MVFRNTLKTIKKDLLLLPEAFNTYIFFIKLLPKVKSKIIVINNILKTRDNIAITAVI